MGTVANHPSNRRIVQRKQFYLPHYFLFFATSLHPRCRCVINFIRFLAHPVCPVRRSALSISYFLYIYFWCGRDSGL